MSAWSYEKYYAENREALNKKRRDRYAKDKVYRERVKQQSHDTKVAQKERTKGRVIRKDEKGNEILAYRIGDVAKKIGRSVGVIRFWESEGTIPAPSIPGGQRVYTEKQLLLITELSDRIREAEKSEDHTATKTVKDQMKATIAKQWKKGV